jgi:FkbM family methyltransferase
MYSQENEETYILAAAERAEAKGLPRRFLDIGSYNPTYLSNTRALYERGWGGICIEPSPGPVKALVQEYGNSDRVIVIAAAMGLNRGLLEMRVSDDALSSGELGETGHVAAWGKNGGYYGTLYVPVLTLDDFIYRFRGDFSFVNIDIEGPSVDLFIAMMKLGWHPHCVCVEFIEERGTEDTPSHYNRMPEIGMAAAPWYNIVYLNQVNAVMEVKA